jgi:hypothetical protein
MAAFPYTISGLCGVDGRAAANRSSISQKDILHLSIYPTRGKTSGAGSFSLFFTLVG